MRRLVSVAVFAAISIGLVVPAADAATTPVVSYKGLPSDWFGFYLPCSLSGSPGDYSPTHVTGPSTPPVQQGSLRVDESASRVDVLGVDFGATAPALSSLTAFSGSVYVPSTSVDNGQFVIDASDGSTTDYALSLAPATRDTWVPLDLTTATLSWQSFDTQSGAPGASGTNTLSDFITAHAGLVVRGVTFEPVAGCEAGTFYLDNIHYAAGSVDKTVDFEAPLPTGLVNGTHPTSVLTGQSVTLSATLTQSGTAFAGQPVQLWARRTGASAYSVVRTVNTDVNGKVSAVVAPTATTAYQWRYAASGNNYAPVNASAYFITTRQRVAISSRPAVASYRGYAVVKGRVTPYKAGVTVRLVRTVSGRQVVVGTARTVTGGYFTIKAPMTVRGIATYEVTALAYTGEAGGQSSTFRITTR